MGPRKWAAAAVAVAAAGLSALAAALWLWPRERPAVVSVAAPDVASDMAPAETVAPAQPAAVAAAVAVSAPVAALSGVRAAQALPGWSKLTLSRPLADVFDAALASGSATDLATAARVLAACDHARGRSPQQLAGLHEMRLSGLAPQAAASAAIGESHRSLLRYCGGADDSAVRSRGDAVRQRLDAVSGTGALWGAPAARPRGEAWPPEQYQAALLTLTDPVARAATLETVLRLLPVVTAPGRAALNTHEAEVVRVLVAQELTGDRDPLSVANSAACAQRAVCGVGSPAFAGDPANRAMLAAARHWAELIRTQQWAAIGLVPGP